MYQVELNKLKSINIFDNLKSKFLLTIENNKDNSASNIQILRRISKTRS